MSTSCARHRRWKGILVDGVLFCLALQYIIAYWEQLNLFSRQSPGLSFLSLFQAIVTEWEHKCAILQASVCAISPGLSALLGTEANTVVLGRGGKKPALASLLEHLHLSNSSLTATHSWDINSPLTYGCTELVFTDLGSTVPRQAVWLPLPW